VGFVSIAYKEMLLNIIWMRVVKPFEIIVSVADSHKRKFYNF
jgi:hypothetical protein